MEPSIFTLRAFVHTAKVFKISRGSSYFQPRLVPAVDLALMRRINEQLAGINRPRNVADRRPTARRSPGQRNGLKPIPLTLYLFHPSQRDMEL